jgi:hypothetical protein
MKGAWFGLLPVAVGVALIAAPWWSVTLDRGDYPLVVVLGLLFAGIGAAVCIPDSWPRTRTLAFAVFFATFGLICAAVVFSPMHPAADGTVSIGGVAGFAVSQPVPWWARAVAAFFGLIFLIAAALGMKSVLGSRN